MTGSALALPLLATGSASAADAATWDRVAACESGGQWSANLGNGAFGGLQMTQELWERHGGLAYATSPDLASRAQQITVAERALASGSTAWATCAPIAGLENDGEATGVHPGPVVPREEEGGVAPESNRTGGTPAGTDTATAPAERPAAGETAETSAPATTPADSTGRAETAETAAETEEARKAPSGSATAPAKPTSPTSPDTSTAPTAPGVGVTPLPATTAPGAPDASTGTPEAPVGTPDGSGAPVAPTTPAAPGTEGSDVASAAPGTGKHRGEAAPEETGKSDTSQESGRHAAAADKVVSTPVNADEADAYTVRPGDSLSEIAQANDLPGGWDALYDANRQTVGTDPDLILPGQSLELTVPSSEK
ncbi:transglycosylase family protein [Streptomyces sp. NPDC057854]|uniref:transglycosylase family protein n=1 Tax=unclassified Streptomyces TaxID=2593676 RepID=UPI00367FA525